MTYDLGQIVVTDIPQGVTMRRDKTTLNVFHKGPSSVQHANISARVYELKIMTRTGATNPSWVVSCTVRRLPGLSANVEIR